MLIIAALGLNIWFNSDVTDDTERAVDSSEVVEPTEPVVANNPSNENSVEVEDAEVAPDFDVVRISKEGDTVIAGRAPAGSTVIVMDGDQELGRVIADESGEWVFLPDSALAPGNRELSLKAETTDGKNVESENIVLLAVPERNTEGEVVDQKPLAVLVNKDGGASRVLQKPTDTVGVEAEAGGLVIDSIDYDDDGNVSIAGRGVAGAQIRGYLDNKVLDNTTVIDDQSWLMKPRQQIEPGVYTLRLDQLVDNKVISRLEIPFNRAEPITTLGAGNFVIVQPGTSLWRIARKTLGSGFSYTLIYDANKEQIRNPDLIYPGQVFQIPESAN